MAEQTAVWQALQDLNNKGKLLDHPKGLHDLQMMVRTIHGVGAKLFPPSGTFQTSDLGTVTWYCQCLQKGLTNWIVPCIRLKKDARHKLGALPVFQEELGEGRARATKDLWAEELKKLHDICGEWLAMWEEIAVFFDEAVYHEFLTFSRQNPSNRMNELDGRLQDIFLKLESLIKIFYDFEKAVGELDEVYFAGVRMHARLKFDNEQARKRLALHQATVAKIEEARARKNKGKSISSEEKQKYGPQEPVASILEDSRYLRRLQPTYDSQASAVKGADATSYVLEDTRALRRLPSIEEETTAEEQATTPRRHHRRATAPEYPVVSLWSLTRPLDNAPAESTFQPRTSVRARRPNAPSVPRIFTGSFPALESQIVRQGLDGFQTPHARSDPSSTTAIRVRDFAPSSATTSALLSPATLLQRREAMMSRDAEFETRVIHGESVASRRPSGSTTRARAATVEERSGGLDAWLASPSRNDASGDQAGTPTSRTAVRRGQGRAREQTL
ncbi:hypothetical protein MBLNU230_g8461t1 [Neophaeotheca triangularis]